MQRGAGCPAQRDSKTVGFGGAFGAFCRRGQKALAPGGAKLPLRGEGLPHQSADWLRNDTSSVNASRCHLPLKGKAFFSLPQSASLTAPSQRGPRRLTPQGGQRFAVLNDRPVACQTREPTDPQGERPPLQQSANAHRGAGKLPPSWPAALPPPSTREARRLTPQGGQSRPPLQRFTGSLCEKGTFGGGGASKGWRMGAGQIQSFFISFLLPFCNYLYIMGYVVVFGHYMLHFDGQERCYDSFDRRREGI